MPTRTSRSATASRDITGLLRDWASGRRGALDDLVPALYPELRRIASRQLRAEFGVPSLQSGDLVNEVYLRLLGQGRTELGSRGHFFAICSILVRRILLDRARRRKAAKRQPAGGLVPLEAAQGLGIEPRTDLIELDRALLRLEAMDADAARLVELRFFGGMTVPEVASPLGRSTASVERDWRAARAWLYRELKPQPADTPGPGARSDGRAR